MNTFLLELWSDLKEKKLLPVAVLLALALVAVPFVLAKPAEEAPAPAADVAVGADPAVGAADVLPAELEAAKPLLRTSTLSEFNRKDPFKPLKALRSVEKAAGVSPVTLADGGAPIDDSAPKSTGDTGGDTGSTGGTTPKSVEKEKTVFTYQAVVELTTASGNRKRKVNRLGILPSDTNPLLVFLGVSADDPGEAVFLVDSTVTQAGEGKCRPSPTTCSFLYLTADEGKNEHIFTADDGSEYGIKLLEIRRVQVKAAQASAAKPVAQAGDAVAETASADPTATTAAVASTEEPADDGLAGFGFPLFADEEE